MTRLTTYSVNNSNQHSAKFNAQIEKKSELNQESSVNEEIKHFFIQKLGTIGRGQKHFDLKNSFTFKHISSIDINCSHIKPNLSSVVSISVNSFEIESVQLKKEQQEFDWINNINPFDRIKHLKDLEENWDGYNAPKFSEFQINRALRVYLKFLNYSFSLSANYSDVRPFVAPCSDGSILLEWGGKRFPIRQLEIIIPSESNYSLEFFKTSETLEDEGIIQDNQISKLFDWLFNSK